MLLLFSTLLSLTTTYPSSNQNISKLATVYQNKLLPIAKKTISKSSPELTSLSIPMMGNKITLNGLTLPGMWIQQQDKSGNISTYINDGAIRQLWGIDLLNTNNFKFQPVQWFSSRSNPIILTAQIWRGYRYVDITKLAQAAKWQIETQDNNSKNLVINTPISQIINIRQGKVNTGDRLVLDLNLPTPWQIRQELPVKKVIDPDEIIPNISPNTPKKPADRQWTITLDGIIDPRIIQRYNPQPEPTAKLTIPTPTSTAETSKPPQVELPKIISKIEVVNNKTVIRLQVPFGQSLQINTLNKPYRLVIDLREDALVPKSIAWAQGLQWQQQFVNIDKDRFPVVSLLINPRTVGLTIKPIISNNESVTGTAPLLQTAQKNLAVAAINGGYFNRNNKLPLGAIRRDQQWISGPILNRGAIAWNNTGQFYFGRLTLIETLTTDNNQTLPVILLNTGYIQRGIARYTTAWGKTYTPLSDNEIIFIVENNQITNRITAGKAGTTPIPIPKNGYLLTYRNSTNTETAALKIGTKVNLTSNTTPPEFNKYEHIIGAGPLLVENKQIVLNGEAEKFSPAFMKGQAVRSSICTLSNDNLLIVAVNTRAGGGGPTLAEQAKIMQTMGCVNALNLDGGSSTSLYLGGQLLDRTPNTAASVHNSIGIFLEEK